MPSNQPLVHVRDLIARGEIGTAIEELVAITWAGSRERGNDALLLSSRFARLVREEYGGTIGQSEARTERNRIAQSALALLDSLNPTAASVVVSAPAPSVPASDLARMAPLELHKIIGTNNLKQIAWLEEGVRASRAVCRVLTPSGLGTGFLIGPNALMTNHHVVPSMEVASATRIEFNFQMHFGGQLSSGGSARYALAPDALFHTSAALDYTIAAVAPAPSSGALPLDAWGHLQLNPNADPVFGEHVVIVQHPNGGPKQIVLTANFVLRVSPPHLLYSTDTMPGSSGSPVFNDLWQVIAIHHASGPTVTAPNGSSAHSNEGILVSAIWPEIGALGGGIPPALSELDGRPGR